MRILMMLVTSALILTALLVFFGWVAMALAALGLVTVFICTWLQAQTEVYDQDWVDRVLHEEGSI